MLLDVRFVVAFVTQKIRMVLVPADKTVSRRHIDFGKMARIVFDRLIDVVAYAAIDELRHLLQTQL